MKVPEPKKLDSGSWRIQLRLGGQSISITDASKKECVKKAQLLKAEYLSGKKLDAKTEKTLGKMIDAYIEKYGSVLSPATVRGYDIARRHRFKDYMELPPSQIKDWQEMINAELRFCSEKTVINAWGVVTAALNENKIPLPDIKLKAAPENELSFLEPEEIPLFLSAAAGDPCEIEMLLELHGLRASEALQVVHENLIDLKHGVINVHGAIVRGKDGFAQKQTNKTKAGTRAVTILIPRLAELVKQYQDKKQPIPTHSPTMILKHVHQICAKAQVTDVTNHGLRRTFASLGYSLGISEKVLQEMGGWDDPGTMHKIYIKLASRNRKEAVKGFQDFYRPATEEEIKGQAKADLLAFCERYKGYDFCSETVSKVTDIASRM